MTIKIKKIGSAKSLAVALNKVKPVKRFDAKKYLGKVKWNEDPLEFQKRMRDEWNQCNCIIAELNSGIKERTKEILQTINIKLPDAIVAATAMYLDLPLLTFDSDFTSVPGLKLFILEE